MPSGLSQLFFSSPAKWPLGNPGATVGPPVASLESDFQALEAWESITYAFWASQGWDPTGESVLLAVSGGADSTALLQFWAQSAGPKFSSKLAVAHINHGLRISAAHDEAFVTDLCRELGLPLYRHALAPSQKPMRESTEMWARRERYHFFAKVAESVGAKWILTGHHRDDLVETVFQRLGRGTGPRGLSGIPFRREPGIVRPFLNRSHAELLTYLRLRQTEWCEDESNLDTRINRNWVRHIYLPELRLKEPNLDARIFKMAMQIQAIGKGISLIEEEAQLLSTDSQGQVWLSKTGVAERIASEAWESLGFWLETLVRKSYPSLRPRPVTKEILDEFCRQWAQDSDSLQVAYSQGIAWKSGNNGVYCLEIGFKPITSEKWSQDSGKKRGDPDFQKVILDVTASSVAWLWGNGKYLLSAHRYSRPSNLVYPASSERQAIFDADLFSCTLEIRTREPGDCFSPFGIRSHSRKLKAFLNEKKVPVKMRNKTPILFCGDTLAWVPGYGISDFFKVTETTTSILELVLKCENL